MAGAAKAAGKSPAKDEPVKRKRILPGQSQVFFYLILILMLVLTWNIFKPFVIFIVTGVFVAVLALPIDKMWERILPNRVAAFGTMFTLFLLLTAPLVGLGFALANDVQFAIDYVQEGNVEDLINGTLDVVMADQTAEERNATVQQIWGQVQPVLTDFLKDLAGQAVGFVGKLLIAIAVILFVVYYVLTDGDKLVRYVRRAAPLPGSQVDFLMHEAHNGLKAVFYGQIMTSVIQGVLGGIGFLIVGLPGVFIWSAVMAILSLLPVIGPPVVWAPAAVYLLVNGEIWQGIFLLAYGGLLVSQVDNFLRPKLIGDRADIHPLFVLIGVLGGVAAFGFIGLFLGPLLVGLTVSILKVWESEYLDPGLVGVVEPEPETAGPKQSRWGRKAKKKE